MADSADGLGCMPAAYLDIETSLRGEITVIGIHRPGQGTVQLVGEQITVALLLQALEHIDTLKTYNGARFDLPVIQKRLGLDLVSLFNHCDLMFTCWKQGLKGGLKAVERQLGIVRVSAGIDGIMAMQLWDQWERTRDREALDRLLQYNREDVELLAEVEIRLHSRLAGTDGSANPD
jgi:uncharacterized protein YprB with RNaseH-like and TPR domain